MTDGAAASTRRALISATAFPTRSRANMPVRCFSSATISRKPTSAACFRGDLGGSEAEDHGVDLARLAHAAQCVLAERCEPALVADRFRQRGRRQYLMAERLAQELDAGDLVDRRPDHREIEPVDGAD